MWKCAFGAYGNSEGPNQHAYCPQAFYNVFYIPGPSCSKLTTSLVNDSLKFISSDMQIC